MSYRVVPQETALPILLLLANHALLCWSVSDADRIRALAAFLKGFVAIWETDAAGRDRLVFLSPQLVSRYKELLRAATLKKRSGNPTRLT